MDWTIGPLDYFFNFYFGPFSLDHFIFFFWNILSGVHTISTQGGVGCSLSVSREE